MIKRLIKLNEDKSSLYRKVLDHAGYTNSEPTEEEVVECFKDYVDSGIWSNLTLDDVNDLTIEEMCNAILKLK